MENRKFENDYQKMALDEQYVIQSARIFDQKIYLQTTQGIHVFPLADLTRKKVYFQQHNFSDVLVDRKKIIGLFHPLRESLLFPICKSNKLSFPTRCRLDPLREKIIC
jgi:hypothetical protein